MSYLGLFAQLVRAEIELWNALDDPLLAETGLSLPTFHALSAIAALEAPVRVQDLSEGMSITVGATSKLVDRLERDGLATRKSNPSDRRSSIIVLSEAGTSALAAAESTAEQHLRSILGADYTPTKADALAAELASLRATVMTGAQR
jgi:DNA-binding MarR family transcriptional regulator